MQFGKFSTKTQIIINGILIIIAIIILALGLILEKKKLNDEAELASQSISFKIDTGQIISKEPIKSSSIDQNHIEQFSEQSHAEQSSLEQPFAVEAVKHDLTNDSIINGTKPEEKISNSKARIAIIIGSLGLSKYYTQMAMNLPKEITFGFSPYAYDLASYIDMAKKAGHELLVNLPLEPMTYPADDMGPLSLLSGLNETENSKRLDTVLGTVKGAIGIYTYDDDNFTKSINSGANLLNQLAAKKLFFVYGPGASNLTFIQIARKLNFPLIVNDIVIDAKINTDSINAKLAELEAIAKKKGIAVGICNPYPLAIDAITKWNKTLEDKNITLIPVSQAIEAK